MRQRVRRGQLAGTLRYGGYLAFSHGWTWAFWAGATLEGTTVWEPPALWFFVIGGLGVLLGGIVMTRLVSGAAGLRDLARRIADPRRIAPRWWAVILLFFPGVTVLAALLTAALRAGGPPLDLAGAAARLADPVGFAGLLGFTLLIGPFPEEIGWRGYLVDQVQRRRTALSASLLVGLLHWSWHLPLFVLPGYSTAFNALPPTPLHLALVVLPVTVLYVWVCNNTGRSVLAVILFHFMGNFSGEFLGISETALTVRLLLTVIVAAAVVGWWGPRTLRRDTASAGRPTASDSAGTPIRRVLAADGRGCEMKTSWASEPQPASTGSGRPPGGRWAGQRARDRDRMVCR